MQAGFFGKHPGFGDFIAFGLPVALREELETWLTATLSQARQRLGGAWEHTYDSARPLRFWIGPAALTDPGALRGVLWASRDKVGRRYPLVVLVPEPNPAPPPISADQEIYQQIEALIADALQSEARQPEGLMTFERFSKSGSPETDTLWAVNPDADVTGLVQAIGIADYTRAACNRSYWWCAADDLRSGAVWSCTGLPDADALAWLLNGVRTQPTDIQPGSDTPFAPGPNTDDAPVSEDTAL